MAQNLERYLGGEGSEKVDTNKVFDGVGEIG
jgi:hypothetical protein